MSQSPQPPESESAHFPDARWAAEVSADLRGLRDSFNQLEHTLLRTLQVLTDQHAAHLAYHRDHEHTWGILRLIQRHPARALAVLVLLATLTLTRSTDPALLQQILQTIQP
jgi:hypothetical protein